MSQVYKLQSDTENFSHFVEQYKSLDESFVKKYLGWKGIVTDKYTPFIYKIHPGDNRKKNYHLDISCTSMGMVILSEQAITVLKEVLESSGQIVPIITDSKRKKFFGFYPNKNVYDESIINLELSEYSETQKGKLFTKIVLNDSYPKHEFIFVLKESPMRIFVTEKFKTLVDAHQLKGFDFSEYNLVKVEP